ncbi:MAG: NYN domain-containing protein [Proteobacteria bacterium]|nr:NYN domain-containing protein [Pseudomonadota bacterium]
MNRIAVFVDAGYMFASASELLFGERLRRGELWLANAEFTTHLQGVAEAAGACPLLRIYWYDGTNSGPSPAHLAIAYLENVKLRLGFVNQSGEQKGVDALIFSDLVNLSRNHAISDALILSGDEDLRVGVQQAQEYGVRVHLLGVESSESGNQSAALQREVDTRHVMDAATLRRFLRRRESTENGNGAPVPEYGDPQQNLERLRDLAVEFSASLEDRERKLIMELPERAPLPHELDRELLSRASEMLGRKLEETEKRILRGTLRAVVCESA